MSTQLSINLIANIAAASLLKYSLEQEDETEEEVEDD